MLNAIATAVSERTEGSTRLTVTSIGTATPANAASVALGLGVAVPEVMRAFYRAPTVLVEGLSPDVAKSMAVLLTELGCEVVVEDQARSPPDTPALVDVALYVADTSRYAEMAEALAAFLGCSVDDAARHLATPPGVVIGGVSAATVEALAKRLGEGASLVTSDPDAARYHLFLGDCEPVQRARLIGDIKERGHAPVAESGLILADLDRSTADAIWASHRRMSALRVVNRDFLRFDIVLCGGAEGREALKALTEVAGVPEHIVPRLFPEIPITVMEAVPNAEVERAMTALAAAGLVVRADLLTFRIFALDILSVPGPGVLNQALKDLGVEACESPLGAPPVRLAIAVPDLQARLMRDALRARGIDSALADLSEVMS